MAKKNWLLISYDPIEAKLYNAIKNYVARDFPWAKISIRGYARDVRRAYPGNRILGKYEQ